MSTRKPKAIVISSGNQYRTLAFKSDICELEIHLKILEYNFYKQLLFLDTHERFLITLTKKDFVYVFTAFVSLKETYSLILTPSKQRFSYGIFWWMWQSFSNTYKFKVVEFQHILKDIPHS